ncbi:MAG: FAD-linked oxidase C-terminal domain-containing protein [Planctomycetota bacterium]|nr:FAD-linked oxidase C-terminal domain-containing protein [Planctomycetota bacterium]
MDARIAEGLRALVGDSGLVTHPTRRATYESDGLAHVRRVPDLVLMPRNTRETALSLRFLAAWKVPIVPRGAGTGLSGGATPVDGGVLLSTARMRDVLEVDVENRFARVQAGVVNVDLTHSCAQHGLFYAPDPSSQKACTIGGNVAENSGGPHCFKYGSTTQHVLGLVFVTAAGDIVDLSRPAVDPSGLDLVGIFVGSEGLLGVATEVTVKLVPTPPVVETLLAIFTSLDAACDSVTDVIAARLEPSALEILDDNTIRAIEASVLAAGYPTDARAVLLVECEGTEVEVASNLRDIETILARHGAYDVRRARAADERARLWAGRKGAYGAMGRIAPDLYVTDAVVPRTRLRELVRATTDACEKRGLRIANVFHAGDGNLHPNISYDRRDANELARVLDAGNEIMRLCLAAGGSLTGEHGVGLEKIEGMEQLFTHEDLAAMCRVREAFDPEKRMNPGKLLPVRACMETRTKRVEG